MGYQTPNYGLLGLLDIAGGVTRGLAARRAQQAQQDAQDRAAAFQQAQLLRQQGLEDETIRHDRAMETNTANGQLWDPSGGAGNVTSGAPPSSPGPSAPNYGALQMPTGGLINPNRPIGNDIPGPPESGIGGIGGQSSGSVPRFNPTSVTAPSPIPGYTPSAPMSAGPSAPSSSRTNPTNPAQQYYDDIATAKRLLGSNNPPKAAMDATLSMIAKQRGDLMTDQRTRDIALQNNLRETNTGQATNLTNVYDKLGKDWEDSFAYFNPNETDPGRRQAMAAQQQSLQLATLQRAQAQLPPEQFAAWLQQHSVTGQKIGTRTMPLTNPPLPGMAGGPPLAGGQLPPGYTPPTKTFDVTQPAYSPNATTLNTLDTGAQKRSQDAQLFPSQLTKAQHEALTSDPRYIKPLNPEQQFQLDKGKALFPSELTKAQYDALRANPQFIPGEKADYRAARAAEAMSKIDARIEAMEVGKVVGHDSVSGTPLYGAPLVTVDAQGVPHGTPTAVGEYKDLQKSRGQWESLSNPGAQGGGNGTGVAAGMVGQDFGAKGCANGVCAIAKAANVPVPQTGNAAQFEKQLPSKGWVQTGDPNKASIFTGPGSGPSGRHVGWIEGGMSYQSDHVGASGPVTTLQPYPIPRGPDYKYWTRSTGQSGQNQPAPASSTRTSNAPVVARTRTGKTFKYVVNP